MLKRSFMLRVSLTAAVGALCFLTLRASAEKAEPAAQLVRMTTSMGEILIELDVAKAPITCDNFLEYVDSGYFVGTIFHRVIDGFMIQGGGMTTDMKRKATRAPIKNEASNGLKNLRGTIAMARTNDPNSATSQFFINVVDNKALDYTDASPGYCVFGKVISGMDVVDKIKSVKTTMIAGSQNVPVDPVIIMNVKRETKKQETD